MKTALVRSLPKPLLVSDTLFLPAAGCYQDMATGVVILRNSPTVFVYEQRLT